MCCRITERPCSELTPISFHYYTEELHLYHTNLEGDMPLEVCSLRSQKDGLKVLTSDCVSTVSCNSDCCTECFS